MAITKSYPENAPHILVLGVGGTIAGIAPDSSNPTAYKSGEVGIQALLEHIQDSIPDSLNITCRQLANIDSCNLDEELLSDIGVVVRQSLSDPLVKGIVITHGTDTIEEIGFFLSTTCGKLAETSGKRVVLTGAMLPSNAQGADGPQNFLDALKWASTAPENCPGGVYGVFAGKVCIARDLAKRHTSALNAPLMDSPTSPIGLINPSWLSMVKAVQESMGDDLPIPQGKWPWVEILVSHAGASAQMVEALIGAKIEGLVLAGTGMGSVHQSWIMTLQKACEQGVALVRASRTGAGLVADSQDGLKCALAGSLSAPKARIALQLALNAAKQVKTDPKSLTWQDFFARIAVLPEFR